MGDKDNGKNHKKRALVSPRRTSDRPKAPRVRPETVPDELIAELLKEDKNENKSYSAAEPTSRQRGLVDRSSLVGGSSSSDLSDESPLSPVTSSLFSESLGGKSRPFSQANFLGDNNARSSPKIQARDPSNQRDNAQPTASGEQRQKSPIQAAPTEGTSEPRGGAQRRETYPISIAKSRSQVPTPKPIESSITPDPVSKPKPKVRGLFWIITSPEPYYSEESWDNGQIKGKSLSTVIKEISSITNRDCIEKLKIRLKTPFAQTTTTVHKDAEDHWEIAKSNLEEKIKEAFTRDRNQQTHFQIWLEPLYEQNAPMGGIDDVENGEIDW